MDEAGSFGAGRAGSAFDLIAFIKQPQTVLRVLAWIFSMVVFASIINEGYVNMGSERLHCVFNKNADACNYGITIGIVAFLACVFFLAMDVYFPQISSVKNRKRAVLLEMAGLTVCAVQRFLLGTDMTLFTTEHMSAHPPKQPYPSNDVIGQTTIPVNAYQSPPLIETVETCPPGYKIPPAF
ncbi:hypothetical protein cypCar_00033434 [Cyprinus carpio]|nr:hypothetical protein cypCar_00033434 [Cyprinus carpio]